MKSIIKKKYDVLLFFTSQEQDLEPYKHFFNSLYDQYPNKIISVHFSLALFMACLENLAKSNIN